MEAPVLGDGVIMAALPYMRMYWADYDADTSHLTTMQHGIYLMLIKNYWQRGGPLPNDDDRLAKIARVSPRDWSRNRDTILEFFAEQENLLVHPRLSLELARVEAKSLNNKRPGNTNAKRTRSERDANETRSSIYTEADTEEEKKEEVTPPRGGKPFVFEGRVIRLQRREYEAWKKAYPDIDLMASLQSRDDWLATEADERTQKRWFMSTSNHLANLQQKARAVERAPVWDGMP